MGKIAQQEQLVGDVLRLRGAERVREVADQVAPVRRRLESTIGPTLSRAMAGRVLGVSQPALDRWVASGDVPTVITPSGRREVPRNVVIELAEQLKALEHQGVHRHRLAAALNQRREQAASRRNALETATHTAGESRRSGRTPRGHQTAERRSLAYHRLVAARLDEHLRSDARDRLASWAEEGKIHPRDLERWRQVLAQPVGEVAAFISSDAPEARALRQSSPFAGLLTERERREIIDTVS